MTKSGFEKKADYQGSITAFNTVLGEKGTTTAPDLRQVVKAGMFRTKKFKVFKKEYEREIDSFHKTLEKYAKDGILVKKTVGYTSASLPGFSKRVKRITREDVGRTPDRQFEIMRLLNDEVDRTVRELMNLYDKTKDGSDSYYGAAGQLLMSQLVEVEDAMTGTLEKMVETERKADKRTVPNDGDLIGMQQRIQAIYYAIDTMLGELKAANDGSLEGVRGYYDKKLATTWSTIITKERGVGGLIDDILRVYTKQALEYHEQQILEFDANHPSAVSIVRSRADIEPNFRKQRAVKNEIDAAWNAFWDLESVRGDSYFVRGHYMLMNLKALHQQRMKQFQTMQKSHQKKTAELDKSINKQRKIYAKGAEMREKAADKLQKFGDDGEPLSV